MMLVLVLGVAFSLSSCSNDDDEYAGLPSNVIGDTWIAETDHWYYYVQFFKDGTFEYKSESKNGSEGQVSGTYFYNASSHMISCKGVSVMVYRDGEVRYSDDWQVDFLYDESQQLIVHSSNGTIFGKGYAYDNRNLCEECDGTGNCIECGGGGRCQWCDGEGYDHDPFVDWIDCGHCIEGNCPKCNGTGDCQACNGTGSNE